MLSILVVFLSTSASVSALWPLPTSLQTGSTPILLANNLNIQYAFSNPPADLVAAVAQTKTYLQNDKLERLVVGGGAADADKLNGARSLSSLSLKLSATPSTDNHGGGGGSSVVSISANAILPVESRDESYSLSVPSDGSAATITANTTLGLYRGLTTFSQLWYYNAPSTYYSLLAPITISDKPAYVYRGLMLDTARHFFPVSDILRTLDAMSWMKINTFHWHVVDSQSFPLTVPGFTQLAANGAYNPSSIYSTSDVANVVAYASARGIDVIPEIDTPGHTTAIADTYPEHIACANAAPWTSFANEPPAGQLRLANPATINFTASLISAASALFPGSYFSTGGDEITPTVTPRDAETQSELTASGKTFEQALSAFVVSNHAALKAKGKTPVVWEEMVNAHNVTLANNTVVMVWISSANAAGVAAEGYRIVHAPSDYFYLDCGHGGWVGDFPQGNSWCDPFKTWQYAYSFDPQANIPASQAHLVLGGQHLLWTEQSSPANLDSIVWPRAGSSAELFWSGPGGNITAALPRLHDISYRFIQRGVNAIPLQPTWCALRPDACDLNA